LLDTIAVCVVEELFLIDTEAVNVPPGAATPTQMSHSTVSGPTDPTVVVTTLVFCVETPVAPIESPHVTEPEAGRVPVTVIVADAPTARVVGTPDSVAPMRPEPTRDAVIPASGAVPLLVMVSV
jgi:hypothetical protein